MDTRSKILTCEAVCDLPRPLAVATGYFDVLVAGHARDLECVRKRTGAPLLVAVRPMPGAVLSPRARAELVAALRVVDYVVIADDEELDTLIDRLRPAGLAHLERAGASRTRQLREHVRSRQIR